MEVSEVICALAQILLNTFSQMRLKYENYPLGEFMF